MAQLVHHAHAIVQDVLDAIHIKASLSLEAILALLPALARDLQQEFMPWVGPTMQRLTMLLLAGADSNADMLGVVFRCVSALCKYLVRHVAPDPTPLLAATRAMRHHAADHVRVLTAEAVAYVLRQCAPGALQTALVVLLRGMIGGVCFVVVVLTRGGNHTTSGSIMPPLAHTHN